MGIGPKPSEAPAAGVDVTTGASAEVPSAGITGASAAGAASSAKPAGPLYAEPIWPTGTPLSMWVYVNTAPTWQEIDPSAPTLSWDDLTLGDWKDVREADLLLDVPASVQNNGSWYMDVFLVKDGGEIVGRSPAEIAHHRKGEWEDEERAVEIGLG
jgi:hypothetical protein